LLQSTCFARFKLIVLPRSSYFHKYNFIQLKFRTCFNSF
jgi:hypothetical protein